MTATLAVCAILTALLSAYSLGHYYCAAVFLFGRVKRRTFGAPDDAVAILIPAKNEAERALRAINSLLRQDHRGPIEIYLLVKDRSDTSVPLLRSIYPDADFDGSMIELEHSERRSVVLAFTGTNAKSDKINWMTRRLTQKYVGILDADHQADRDWVRTSVALLFERGARIIQGRRGPLSARGFYQLWDSLHQHIGCELFNLAFARQGLTVFFTGTTALMETELLREHPLSECITEDVDFSYTILLEGVRIIDNPYSGSCEETSPDLYSFLARRRRWSNGHTSAFFRHLRLLGTAPISMKERIQFVYHGAHYLVAAFVFILHLAIGLVFVRSLSPTSQLAAGLLSLTLAARIAYTQRTSEAAWRVSDVVVVFGWLAPAVVISMNFLQAVIVRDLSRASLQIPEALQAIGLVGLSAPLIVLLIGLIGFRQLSLGTFLAVVVTYPFAFFLDLCGVLLGIADWVTSRARWRPVSRAAPASLLSAADPMTLLPALHIEESWRFGPLLSSGRSMLAALLRRPSRLIIGTTLLGLFCVGVLYEPGSRIPVARGRCQVLEHDGEPWIVPAKRLKGYCTDQGTEQAVRTGTFKLERKEDLGTPDLAFWDRLDSTFFCNLAVFSPDHAISVPGEGMKLELAKGGNGDKGYSSGSIATKTDPDAQYQYGRFEIEMKPAKGSGMITAFFLYRFDPWQEIDAEILGRDPTKLLVNVYYNPGEEGDLYNYGLRGTPVLVDLGFDASLDFHRFAIEWEKEEIRWFVDDKLVHVRHEGRPTPIPHLPMRLHANLWPCCSEELAGPFTEASVPATAELRSVSISRWYPAPLPQLLSRLQSLFASEEDRDWRKSAKWIQ